jgi:hypothetical protein
VKKIAIGDGSTVAQFREQAAFLRESSGSTNIEKTLLRALKVLKLFHIRIMYVAASPFKSMARFTVDVNLIVPDVEFALEKLSINGFKQDPGSRMTVADRETKVEVDLLPGGKKVDSGPLALPLPTHVSEKPQILTLEELISAKLSTYLGRGIERGQDHADGSPASRSRKIFPLFPPPLRACDEFLLLPLTRNPDLNLLYSQSRPSQNPQNPLTPLRQSSREGAKKWQPSLK